MPSAEALRTRWLALMPGENTLFGDLCSRYSEPHRHYHTLAHLGAVFDALDPFEARLANSRAVAFAVFYHDVIYDTARPDNEERSAAYALEVLGTSDEVQSAARMIRATKNHTAAPHDADEALFLDADFSILGAPPARYSAYVDEVRAEYGWLADDAWRAGRLAFLTKAKAAPRLFHTDPFETQCGAQARANIAWEIARLT